MKIKYVFPVSCRGKFPEGISFPLHGNEIELVVKDNKFVQLTLSISEVPRHAWPRIEKDSEGHIEIKIVDHPKFPWNEVKSLVRTIEGGLSFWGVSEIDIINCKTEWVPESQQEIDELELTQITRSRCSDNHDEDDASLDMFVRTIMVHEQLSDLEIPLNFYRRGRNEMANARSLDATYDFSFLLETMFANGKFRQNDVIGEMLTSIELTDAINKLSSNPSHFNGIKKDIFSKIDSKYLQKNLKQVVAEIVSLRGFIHHPTMKRAHMWHPDEHDIHEPDAVYLSQICHLILAGRVIGKLFDPVNVDRFMATKIATEQGKRIEWIPMG